MAKDKNFQKSEIAQLKDKIKVLRSELGRRDKKIKNLKSELSTLNVALSKSALYIDKRLTNVPIDDVVEYFNDKIDGDISEVEQSYEDKQTALIKKWSCHKCDSGYLRLVMINRHDGQYYMRKCTSCDNRTNVKKFTEDVKGAK